MKFLFRDRLFIRNLYAETLLENFLIATVSTILIIRFYLQLTGYPQIGGEHFHIAHMLYGGLLMMITICILFVFLNRTAYTLASITGGIGFGFFIDELGKFITRDNNYFFQPTVALIYVILISIYVAAEALPKLKQVSKREYLINAIELIKEVVVQDLDTNEKKQALAYLKASGDDDPIAPELRRILTEFRSRPRKEDLYTKLKASVMSGVELIIQSRTFYYFVLCFMIIQSVLSLLITFLLVAALNRYIYLLLAAMLCFVTFYLLRSTKLLIKVVYILTAIIILLAGYYLSGFGFSLTLSFIGFGTVFSAAFAAIIAFFGILEFSRSSLTGLKLMRISILISLFLTQFFLFYQLQFLALVGLVLNIFMLLTIEYVISKNESLSETLEATVKR